MKVSLEDLRALPQKRLQINFRESSSSAEVVKPVLAELTVSVSASGARLTGRIQTLLKLTCHGCLHPFFQPLAFEVDERFVYEDYLKEGVKESRDRELLKQDFVESVPYSGSIDVSDVVYQAVTLAIPAHCSCGPDCPGLAIAQVINNAQAGEDKAPAKHADKGRADKRQIDPRWQNLKKLLPNEGEN